VRCLHVVTAAWTAISDECNALDVQYSVLFGCTLLYIIRVLFLTLPCDVTIFGFIIVMATMAVAISTFIGGEGRVTNPI
jgi:hypothetical protein